MLLQGREQEAERLSQDSEDAAGASDIDAQVRWRRLRSLVVAKRDPKLAERLIRSAVKLADQTDMVRDRAAARADLAEVLRCTGRYREAQDAATEALDLATAKGHRGLAARASALLSRIAQEPTSDG